MKVSILGPSNMDKFLSIIGKESDYVEETAEKIGKAVAENNHELRVVFNYSGVLRLVGKSAKKNGGKIEMLYTKNDYDWEVEPYMKFLDEADLTIEKESWHDMLLSLVSDSDYLIVAGLSAGVFSELGYVKWNFQEGKGNVKKIFLIKELLSPSGIPKELEFDLGEIIDVVSVDELGKLLE